MTSHRPLRSLRVPAAHRARAAVAAAGLAAGLVLAGCSATNPIQTQDQYDASDGVSVTLGDVRAANLMILTTGEGQEGVLHGALTNRGKEPVTVTVTFAEPGEGAATPTADAQTVDVPAGGTVLLTGAAATEDDDRTVDVRVGRTPAAPGDVAVVGVAVDTAGAETIEVPVLDGTLPDYASAVPTPSA